MTKKCLNCKKSFTTDNKQKIYCSQKCRNAYNWPIFSDKQKIKENDKFFDWRDYKNGLIV